MKIEETFRDLKSLLNFHKLMNKRRTLMEKMVAFLLIAYAIALILGETLRNQFSRKIAENISSIPVLSSS